MRQLQRCAQADGRVVRRGCRQAGPLRARATPRQPPHRQTERQSRPYASGVRGRSGGAGRHFEGRTTSKCGQPCGRPSCGRAKLHAGRQSTTLSKDSIVDAVLVTHPAAQTCIGVARATDVAATLRDMSEVSKDRKSTKSGAFDAVPPSVENVGVCIWKSDQAQTSHMGLLRRLTCMAGGGRVNMQHESDADDKNAADRAATHEDSRRGRCGRPRCRSHVPSRPRAPCVRGRLSVCRF